MNCRLIAFDLDGTLLDNDKHIPEETLRALERADAEGVVLVPATGRILRGIPPELRALPFLRWYILSNGAELYDVREGRSLGQANIPLALTLRVMDYLDSLPVLYDCYQDDVGWMSQAMFDAAPPYFGFEPHMLRLLERLRIRVPDLKQTLREHARPVQKIQFFFRPEDNALRLETIRGFSARFPELIASSSTSNNVEVNSREAGKGNGLRRLCAALGIETADCLAFGDGTNDLPLLEAAGRGVAMANAEPALLAAADAVCESNVNCGVAKEIARVLGWTEAGEV